MFSDKLSTTDARQITITKVEKDSPADGVLAVGDVILGVGGKPFSYDPRTELGKALTDGRIGGGRRKLVADPLAGRQDGEGRRETARPRHLQRHRALRLPEVADAFSSRAARRWPSGSPTPSYRQNPITRSPECPRPAGQRQPRVPPAGEEGGPMGAGLLGRQLPDLVLRLRHHAALRVRDGDRRRLGHAGPAASGAGSRQRAEHRRFVGPPLRRTRRAPRAATG